jgi:hypothetical protein
MVVSSNDSLSQRALAACRWCRKPSVRWGQIVDRKFQATAKSTRSILRPPDTVRDPEASYGLRAP